MKPEAVASFASNVSNASAALGDSVPVASFASASPASPNKKKKKKKKKNRKKKLEGGGNTDSVQTAPLGFVTNFKKTQSIIIPDLEEPNPDGSDLHELLEFSFSC